MSEHAIIRLDETDPRARGRARGEQLRADLPAATELYLRLFHAVGVSEAIVRADAQRIADVVDAWDARLVEEIEGIAAGAGLDTWQVAAVNARTEILAQALGTRPGECSTIAHTPATGAPFGIQTWDWHEEMDPFWHLQDVHGTRHSHVGLTEHGILGKIGMNSAGLGVFFNILGHRDDAPTGVPMHLLAAAVLGNAGTVEEALELLRSAPIATSSALTLLDTDTAVCAELSPKGVAALVPRGGFLPHTNHFLDERNTPFEKPGLYDPDSQERLQLVASRLDRHSAPTEADHLIEFLYSDPGQPPLCCAPEPGAPFGRRWATLATVLLEPAHRRARVLAGTPLDARRGPWTTLVAERAPVTVR
ncbi:C45 family autoproteolytic acyltransferase/hydolase [Rhodococcus daqingensis]|uniref:C45 family autoproteolytic acyltransferase/hydrolase n=1 Tax=Rhodococcus daqingensis TaxID=2479363 RepID=A0ABW2RRG6_9NOCA